MRPTGKAKNRSHERSEKICNLQRQEIIMKRDKVIETVKELPQEFELDDLIERLVLVEKVEKGLRQIDQGKLFHTNRSKK